MLALGYGWGMTEGGEYYYGTNCTDDKPDFIAKTIIPTWANGIAKDPPYFTHEEMLKLKRVFSSKKGAKDGFRWREARSL